MNSQHRGCVCDDRSLEFCYPHGGGIAGSMVLGISNAQAGADLANNTDEEKKAMADIILRSDNLLLHLDKKGGAITGFWQQRQGIGKPEEVAMTAVFLASDEAPFINAEIIAIDGGRGEYYA